MDDLTELRDNLPMIPKDLLDNLDARFPPRCPGLDWPDRVVWHYAGQRSVIDFLKAAYQRQQENRFNNVL
jgi:hypothetical protein